MVVGTSRSEFRPADVTPRYRDEQARDVSQFTPLRRDREMADELRRNPSGHHA
jgi:hypothetical protein